MNDESSSSGIGYFLLGLAVGTAGAILLAPCSGERTRERIAETAQDGLVYAKDTVEDLKAQLRVGLDCAEDAVLKFKGRVETSVEQARERLQEAVNAGRVAYQDELSSQSEELPSD